MFKKDDRVKIIPNCEYPFPEHSGECGKIIGPSFSSPSYPCWAVEFSNGKIVIYSQNILNKVDLSVFNILGD